MALILLVFSSAKFLLFLLLEASPFHPLDAWVFPTLHHCNGNPSGCGTFENIALDTRALHILHSWMRYPHVVGEPCMQILYCRSQDGENDPG